jgi:hypothetical protein
MMQTWTNGSVTSGKQLIGQMWMADPLRTGHMATLLANVEVPRGPGMGSHVAPSQGRMESVKNVWGSMGFEPKTTHQAKLLKESIDTNAPHMSLVK